MQKIILLVFILFSLAACTKKETTTPTLTWNFKGITHISKSTYAEVINNNYFQINGEENAFNTLLLFTTSFNVGTYLADSTAVLNGAILSYPKSNDSVLVALTPSGSISISNNSKNKLSGTFNLITQDGDHLDGTFSNVPIN